MNTPTRGKPAILTLALIVVSVLASLPNILDSKQVLAPFLIASPEIRGFTEVLSGQAWRLLTPIFLHFGILHIVFNMMWLWDLGRVIEWTRGAGFLALFVAVTGIAANVAQYLVTGNPVFGGMSGVVYALLGYFWMQGRYNPTFGLALQQSTVIMMLGWYVLCWTGLLGPIANWAHTAGLVLGVAWGFIDRRPIRRAWSR